MTVLVLSLVLAFLCGCAFASAVIASAAAAAQVASNVKGDKSK